MSRRNTRQAKARRRAERDRRLRSGASDQEPRAVEVQAVQASQAAQAAQAAPRPDSSGPRNSDEYGSGLRSDADDGLIAVELDEADLDTDADLQNTDPGDFGDLDPDDADLQATLTVLAVLADDISDVAEVADDLAGDVDGLEVADGLEDLEGPETGQPSAEADAETEGPGAAGVRVKLSPEAGGDDEEIFVFGDDDDDLPAAQVAVAGATADPVKDYLRQIGKVPLLSAEQEVELAKRIEAGLFAEEKLDGAGETLPRDARMDLEWIAEDGRRAKNHLLEANLRLVVSLAKIGRASCRERV